MKIRRKDLRDLINALKGLDGRAVDIKTADGKAEVIIKPYDLAGNVRYAAIRMLAAAKAPLEAMETEHAALFAKHAGGASKMEETHPGLAAFGKDWNAYLAEEVDFTEHRFKAEDLKIEANALPAQLVAALLPVIEGEV